MSRQALQALDKILQYKREDRKSDIQQSLAFMQFAVQKRAADVQVFGKQMEVLKNANQQAKISVAKNFIQNSNLSEIYTSIPTEQGTDINEIGDNLNSITSSINKKLKKGGLKDKSFRKQKSEEIASALWNFKTSNDPSSIVNIASGVNKSINAFTNKTANLQDKNLIKSFNILGNIANLKNVSQMASNVKLNDSNILKEQFEFVKGDTKIQSGFGMFSDSVVKEYQQKQEKESKDLKIDESSIADLIEKEIGDSTVEKEKIYKSGYEPKTANELIEQTSKFLTKEEQDVQKTNIENIELKQSELESSLEKLIEEREDIFDEHAEYEERKNLAKERYDYFSKIGNKEESQKAAKQLNEFNNILDPRNKYNEGSTVREKTAYERINLYGENAGSRGSSLYPQIKGTKTEEIIRIKQSIRELEKQRNLFGQ